MIGGAAGALARAGLVDAVAQSPGAWPWATLAVNLAGAFMLGVVASGFASAYSWAGSGFCGALTTFSGLQVETLYLIRAGDVGLAVIHPSLSIVLGLGLVVAGRRLGRRWTRA